MDKTDGTSVRRSLYGKAGCCRLKPYGVEYRTVSNFWASNPKIVDVMYALTELAVNLRKDGASAENLIANMGGEAIIVNTINNSDEMSSRTLYKTNIEPLLSAEIAKAIQSIAKKASFDVHKNWKLTQRA
jgi:hypothetical protein